MYGSVRSQLMQVSVQKSTRTTWPRSSAGPSGSESSHSVAPPSEGMCTWANTVHLAKRPEARADLFREQLRLLPGRKVPAPVDLVEVDEIGIGLLRPTLRHLIELVRKDTHGYRDGDALRVEEAELVLPIKTSRRDPRVRQPVVGDVVEDVVSGEALGLSVEDTCDQRQTSRVVVEHPGGKADGGIRNSVQRLWVGPHLECIGHVCRKEVPQLLVEACSLVIKTGRRRAAGLDRRCDVGSNSPREVGVDADQPRRRLYTHQINDLPAPIAALGDVAVVSQALHQLRPGTRDVLRAPAGAGWLA